MQGNKAHLSDEELFSSLTRNCQPARAAHGA